MSRRRGRRVRAWRLDGLLVSFSSSRWFLGGQWLFGMSSKPSVPGSKAECFVCKMRACDSSPVSVAGPCLRGDLEWVGFARLNLEFRVSVLPLPESKQEARERTP